MKKKALELALRFEFEGYRPTLGQTLALQTYDTSNTMMYWADSHSGYRHLHTALTASNKHVFQAKFQASYQIGIMILSIIYYLFFYYILYL
jgi:hypothetical protein